jgi:hypothetical protein
MSFSIKKTHPLLKPAQPQPSTFEEEKTGFTYVFSNQGKPNNRPNKDSNKEAKKVPGMVIHNVVTAQSDHM